MQYAAVSALSHEGLVREQNEDSLVVGPWTLCAMTTLNPQTFWLPVGEPLVVAVADGLGGHPAGEVASGLAVRALAHAGPWLADEAAIHAELLACDDLIYDEAALHPGRAAMGTTAAGIVITDHDVFVFNVGDSRVYAVEDGELRQLSSDDNEAPLPGQRRSSVLTQALGGGMDRGRVVPHVVRRPPAAEGRYLVCSDGLTDAIDNLAIAAILRNYEGGRAAFELWKAAIEAGAPDNVTLALVEIGTEPDA
jgi:serine/threonine protein phosphatase PrpC